jgi:uroporphyrinogen decarboxylase
MPCVNKRTWPRLSREEVIKAVERKRPARIPLVFARWWGAGLEDQYGARLKELERYPEDMEMVWLAPIDPTKMGLSWKLPERGGYNERCILDDWAKLDEFVAKLPNPDTDPDFERLLSEAQRIHAEGTYLMFGWWSLLFEWPWNLRGMQNLMVDYYVAPEQVHKMQNALCEHYSRYIRRALREFHPDGFWTSDDLGHQTQLMMNPAVFREFIKPYYARVGALLRAQGVHWWLHSCGNNTEILGDLAEVGVSVLHPIQKHTMNEAAVVREYGDRLTFLAGIDVQHALQEKDPQGVREEVRFMIDTFDQPGGGMCIAAGNGIVSGIPFENIEAFLDEALVYGEKHRQRFAR